MKVYILMQYAYGEGGSPVRVYTSAKLANQSLELLKDSGDTYYEYTLEEFEVIE